MSSEGVLMDNKLFVLVLQNTKEPYFFRGIVAVKILLFSLNTPFDLQSSIIIVSVDDYSTVRADGSWQGMLNPL